jgi:hypothetical protein
MNQTRDNKKNDDLNYSDKPDKSDNESDEIICNCGLCWIVRQIFLILPNNVYFRNPFMLVIVMFVLPIFISILIVGTILKPFLPYLLEKLNN